MYAIQTVIFDLVLTTELVFDTYYLISRILCEIHSSANNIIALLFTPMSGAYFCSFFFSFSLNKYWLLISVDKICV